MSFKLPRYLIGNILPNLQVWLVNIWQSLYEGVMDQSIPANRATALRLGCNTAAKAFWLQCPKSCMLYKDVMWGVHRCHLQQSQINFHWCCHFSMTYFLKNKVRTYSVHANQPQNVTHSTTRNSLIRMGDAVSNMPHTLLEGCFSLYLCAIL